MLLDSNDDNYCRGSGAHSWLARRCGLDLVSGRARDDRLSSGAIGNTLPAEADANFYAGLEAGPLAA